MDVYFVYIHPVNLKLDEKKDYGFMTSGINFNANKPEPTMLKWINNSGYHLMSNYMKTGFKNAVGYVEFFKILEQIAVNDGGLIFLVRGHAHARANSANLGDIPADQVICGQIVGIDAMHVVQFGGVFENPAYDSGAYTPSMFFDLPKAQANQYLGHHDGVDRDKMEQINRIASMGNMDLIKPGPNERQWARETPNDQMTVDQLNSLIASKPMAPFGTDSGEYSPLQ